MGRLSNQRPNGWKYRAQDLVDRRVVLSGGTSGIGRTTALLLAQQGARVLIFGRHQDVLDEAMRDLRAVSGRIIPMIADHAREEDVDRVFAMADEKLGGVDILINNAAGPAQSTREMSSEAIRYAIESDLLGYLSCAKRAIERMERAGGGTIINVGSLSAKGRGPHNDVYVAAKSGIRGWSDALSKQLGKEGIRVTLIEPGTVGADFREQSTRSEKSDEKKGLLLFTEPIAELILYVLVQPSNVFLPLLQIQPHREIIGEG